MKHLLRLLALIAALFIGIASHAADLSITAANVIPSRNAIIAQATAGATITAGQLIYIDSTDLDTQSRGKAKLADANSATAAVRSVAGIAINSAASGQQVSYVVRDTALQIASSGLTAGAIYGLSATAGGLAPSADFTTGWYPSVVAIAKSTTTIDFMAPGLVVGAAL